MLDANASANLRHHLRETTLERTPGATTAATRPVLSFARPPGPAMLDPRDAIRAIGASTFCTTTTISHLYCIPGRPSEGEAGSAQIREAMRSRESGTGEVFMRSFSHPTSQGKKERKKQRDPGTGSSIAVPVSRYGCCWDLWNGVELGRPFRNLDLHWYSRQHARGGAKSQTPLLE